MFGSFAGAKQQKTALSDTGRSGTMVEANDDTLEPVAALDDDDVPKFPIDDLPKTINDLPKELLVSVFEAVEDQSWVRLTFPLVCKEWAEIYRSRDASPLHETLEVDFEKEVQGAATREGEWEEDWSEEIEEEEERAPRRPSVQASRVISWAERRAGSVRKLRVKGGFGTQSEDFSSCSLGRLVAVAGSSLTELRIGCGFYGLPVLKPFWMSLRNSIVPAGRLRSLVVEGIADASESDVDPIGQLAGSLEELVLNTRDFGVPEASAGSGGAGLPRFPESLCGLTELRHLELFGHSQINAISATISSLKNLERLALGWCRLSSLPKELGELSGLTKLNLSGSSNLGNAPQDVTFPAELGKMKSLRVLILSHCGLRTVPAFVGELESLELLDLSYNDVQIDATLDSLIKGCPRLREVWLCSGLHSATWTPATRAQLEVFKARLRAENPNAKVIHG